MTLRVRVVLAAAALLVACALVFGGARSAAQEPPETAAASETARLQAWIEETTRAQMARRFGGRGPWAMPDEARAAEVAAQVEADLATLRSSFDVDALDLDGLIAFRGFERAAEQSLADYRWREQVPVFDVGRGPHLEAPQIVSFPMMTTLPPDVIVIETDMPPGPPVDPGEAYLGRLEAADDFLDAYRTLFEARAAKGFLPSRDAFPAMVEAARGVISGAPFEPGPPSSLLTAVSRNINALDADDTTKTELLNRATAALVNDWAPAYERLIVTFEQLETIAPEDSGFAARPDGRAYYDRLIQVNTTTELTADEVRTIGLHELARVHSEIRAAMAGVGFVGTIEEFFDHLRTDDQFYYPDTDEGRAAYLAETRRVIAEMQARLDEVVHDPPDAPIDVIRFPSAVEATSVAAMYMPSGAQFMGSRDRPREAGAYVVNLADMRAAPKFLLQALTYHESVPGHHLAFSIDRRRRRENDDRQAMVSASGAGPSVAYAEGWGLYAEELPHELGLYTDPYADIGRLGMEAWRAARLVVDVGLHADAWSKEQAVAFMLANTPLAEAQVRIEVDRYVNIPGQATAYMIGKLKILELRERAETALGEDFDLRAFHAEVLGHGALPLDVLDEVVTRWIAEQAA